MDCPWNRRELQYLVKELGLGRANLKSEVLLERLQVHMAEMDERGLNGHQYCADLVEFMPEEMRMLGKTPRKTPSKAPGVTPGRVTRSSARKTTAPEEEEEGSTSVLLFPKTVKEEEEESPAKARQLHFGFGRTEEEQERLTKEPEEEAPKGVFQKLWRNMGFSSGSSSSKKKQQHVPITAEVEGEALSLVKSLEYPDEDDEEEVEEDAPSTLTVDSLTPMSIPPVFVEAQSPTSTVVTTELENSLNELQTLAIAAADDDFMSEQEEQSTLEEQQTPELQEEEVEEEEEPEMEIMTLVSATTTTTQAIDESTLKVQEPDEIQEEPVLTTESEEEMSILERGPETTKPQEKTSTLSQEQQQQQQQLQQRNNIEIERLVASLDDLSFNDSRERVTCVLTGHEMVLSTPVILAHLGGKKYTKAKKKKQEQAEAQATTTTTTTSSSFFVPYPEAPTDYLLCTLTDKVIRNSKQARAQHVQGSLYRTRLSQETHVDG